RRVGRLSATESSAALADGDYIDMRGLHLRRRALRRLVTGGAMAVLMVGLAVALAAPAAMAQQEQQHATLTGADLPEPLEFTAEEHPTQYADVERELAWLLSRRSDSPEPDPDTLGPEYELIWYRGERGYRFFLYPLAQGGPRVFRPAEQPDDRTVRAAWYFARLTLPDTLREIGRASGRERG